MSYIKEIPNELLIELVARLEQTAGLIENARPDIQTAVIMDTILRGLPPEILRIREVEELIGKINGIQQYRDTHDQENPFIPWNLPQIPNAVGPYSMREVIPTSGL